MKSLVVAGIVVLTAAGCGSQAQPAPSVSVSAAASDVAFAQAMIPHHEEAVMMADLALAPDAQAGPEVRALAEQIRAAQNPEIAQMTGWLQQWGAATSMPMDHSDHDMSGMSVSGMMTADQMAALTAVSGGDFDRLWTQMMIEHHQGAIAMAEQVRGSRDSRVAQLAGQIIEAQQAEIAQMQQ